VVASQDAYVNNQQPNTNYGKDTAIYIDKVYSLLTRGFVWWDLSTYEGKIVYEARLCLHTFTFADPHGAGCAVYKLGASWSEMAITWNNQPSEDSFVGILTSKMQDFSLDVFDLVQDWLSGEPNHGIMLRLYDESFDAVFQFYAREHTDYPPGSRPALYLKLSP
jgi:hypothetical protein